VLLRLLHPLDRRQQTLLLTMMSFGGSQASQLLELLGDDDAKALRSKMQTLEDIPKEKRVPLMVRELKGLLQIRASKGLEGIEPSWLAAGFKGESPRVIAATLAFMPPSLAKSVTQRLPEGVQRLLPAREDLSSIPLDVIKIIRARYDAKFAVMPLDRELNQVRFVDLVMLSARELVMLLRALGTDEIACAFLVVGKRAFAEFLSRMPNVDGQELIAAVRRTDPRDQMEARAAQVFLAKVLSAAPASTSTALPKAGRETSGAAFSTPDELFQKAGIYRLARAVVMEQGLFLRQLTQRLPRAHGRLLLEYVQRARELHTDTSNTGRLRDQVLEATVALARRGKIDARFGVTPELEAPSRA
jgi:flagellar motor switch protein FliG